MNILAVLELGLSLMCEVLCGCDCGSVCGAGTAFDAECTEDSLAFDSL